MNAGATIRCLSCGLEVTGALVNGRLKPSDRVRPDAGQPVMDGYCMRCIEEGYDHPQCGWECREVGGHARLATQPTDETDADDECTCGHYRAEHSPDGGCAGCDAGGQPIYIIEHPFLAATPPTDETP